jgi:hypothetical protein
LRTRGPPNSEQKANMLHSLAMARRPDFGGEKFFSREDLKAMARSMSFLSESAIRDIYQRAYRDCQIVNSKIPTARAVQELVQAWKQLRKWRR